jgi:hypothetical protein
MKIRITISALLLMASSISHGQALPTASPSTAPSNSLLNLSPLDGVLHYALSASEVVQYGYYGAGEVSNSSVLSGDVAYTSTSTKRPFSMLFAGGVSIGNQGGQGTTSFWNVAASQGYVTRKWVFNISDSFSFLPQSPTTGVSGIPGVGDLGAIPVPGPVEGPAGGVLSGAGNRIGNSVAGSAERQLDHATSISGAGSWSILHFLDNPNVGNPNLGNTFLGGRNLGNLDNSEVSATVALNRRIDKRSSASLNAVYSTYTYSGPGSGFYTPDIETRGINLSYQRLLSRTLSVSVSAGPQWVNSSNSLLIPPALNVAATASLSYSRRLTNATVSYTRGANGGSGVLPGATSDSVGASVGHSYGRDWVASATVAYTHTSGLTQLAGIPGAPANEIYDTVFGGIQVTRRISTRFSGYISYGAQNQSSNFFLPGQNALNGTSQNFGIGITFTPRSTRLGQF